MLALAAAMFALLVPQPSLLLLGTHPVRVQGARFRPGEAVRVTVRAAGTSRHVRVVAGRRGGFSARFRGFGGADCTQFTVTAVGASGDRALAPDACIQ